MRRRNKKRTMAGVTLIEMLVVVTIIALFVGVVGIKVFKRADDARVVATKQQISTFLGAAGIYKLDTGVYPTTEQGLQALRLAPANVNGWKGPYLQQDIPLDNWGHPYLYKYPGEHGDDPDIVSLGADGQPGGEGYNADIVSWALNR